MLACHLIVSARDEDVNTSLYELAEAQQIDADELSARVEVEKILDFYGMELVPGIRVGAYSIPRILRSVNVDSTRSRIEKDIRNDEDDTIEFKSSLFFDRKKFERSHQLTKAECYSEDVLHSSLKTVGAFLNTQGGRLYVGISNDGICVGIEDDLECKKNINDFDKYQLFFRDKISSSFHSGSALNNYIKCCVCEFEGRNLFLVDVSATPFVCFLKNNKNNFDIFLRDGNRTKSINMFEVEKYYEMKKLF